MSVRILRLMTVIRPMGYALIPMDPISVAVKQDTVGMESPALVSQSLYTFEGSPEYLTMPLIY